MTIFFICDEIDICLLIKILIIISILTINLSLNVSAITITASTNWSSNSPVPTSDDPINIQKGAILTVNVSNQWEGTATAN